MKQTFTFAIVILFAIFLNACNKTPCADPRADLVTASGDAGASAFYFGSHEDDGQSTHFLTNKDAASIIKIGKDSKETVLRYTRVTDKKSNTATLYKSSLLPKNNSLTLTVTDVTAGKTIFEKVFQDDNNNPPDTTAAAYNSLEECIADFNCLHKGELQCLANKTCENQFGALICCLKNGQCFSVHLIIPPTSWRCHLRDLIPDLEGLVFSRE